MELNKLKNILEAVLLAADRTLTVIHLESLFEQEEERPTRDEIRKALHEMAADYESRGYQLKQVASGFRLQVRQEYANWVGRLWEEKPARYTRALLETMALIAYRQPITRGEIEEVRGVSVSSNIIKTLLERDWIKVLGHKDVPGKPTLYGTTKEFLDYFNLKTLDQLPTLAEIKDLDSIHPELELDEDVKDDAEESGDSGEDAATAESSGMENSELENTGQPVSNESDDASVVEDNEISNVDVSSTEDSIAESSANESFDEPVDGPVIDTDHAEVDDAEDNDSETQDKIEKQAFNV